MKKKPITFAPMPTDDDVVVGPQAFRMAAEVGIDPVDAGLRFAWAQTVTGKTIYFDKARDTEWQHAADWVEVEAHFKENLNNPRPSMAECFGH